MRTSELLLAVAISVLVAPTVHAAGPPSDPRPTRTRSEERLIDALWQFHEESVSTALPTMKDGGTIDQRAFSRAVKLFEEVTGIRSDTGTFFGRLPTPHLERTSELWGLWFAANRARLRFDGDGCLLLLPALQGARTGKAPD